MKKYEKIKHMKKVLKYFGSILNLSRELKISRAAIYKWKKIPECRAYRIEKITKGKIKSSSLFP